MKKISFNLNDIINNAENLLTYKRGFSYYIDNKVGKIHISRTYNDESLDFLTKYSTIVKGKSSSFYDTSVRIDDDGDIDGYNCDCKAFSENNRGCKHIVATLLKIYHHSNSKIILYDDIVIKDDVFKYKKVNTPLEDLINIFEDKIIDSVKLAQKEGTVILSPKIFIADKETIGIEFTIGEKRQYIIKDAYELAKNIKNASNVEYGKYLEFNHEISGFENSSKQIAQFLSDEAEVCRKVLVGLNGRVFKILPFSMDNFFDLFENKTVDCHGFKYQYQDITFINKDPDVEFYIKEENEQYYLTTNLYISFMANSNSNTYIIVENKLYKCSKEFVDTVLLAVRKIMQQPTSAIILSNEYIAKFCSTVLPKLSEKAVVKTDFNINDKLNIAPLSSSIYFDCNKLRHIYANVIFKYGDISINPLVKAENDNLVVRNIIEETKMLIAIENVGFNKVIDKYVLMNEDKIYEFITNGINKLTSVYEVNVSEDFKKINIRYPKSMSMGVKLNSNLIEIDINKPEFKSSELKDILSAYKIKKKYFRLKDGSFLSLDNDYFKTIEKLVEDLDISGEELDSGHIEIPKYRSLYLDSLIKNNVWVNAEKSQNYKKMIRGINDLDDTDFIIPEILRPILRNYQVTGYKWLKTLSHYSLGGILADDMGLGKTLQIISLLLSDKNINHKTSIVICPTSLLYNWKSEVKKFAPEIKALIIVGNASERSEIISNITDYDLILTSYDLIKRDIEIYENFEFNYCILDEAQYIKNASTLNAKAVKLIKSNVRFALTGTPIENSLSDLWSIFDFIMPGFLFSYKKFRSKYEIPIVRDEDKSILTRLHKQIQPFILRRLKKDVLKELPDKIETLSYAQMGETQRKLYLAELMKLNKLFNDEINEHGYEKSQIRILSMLTRLRQICCDPSLYFEDYNGGSAKLELCMEIVQHCIENNHKILIFSQFTSMLSIIAQELNKNSINYYLLTGATKSVERLQLANAFNTDNTPVFLISLKAGGTGLNLTGADVVIHYDPWWNISTQNQATDRTHRIGQNNKVQVFKLITNDSIEEKIEKLQQNKKHLAEAIIQKGEILINKLSKEEIYSLFEV